MIYGASLDDPKKTKEDATRFNRHEEYEVLDMINSLKGQNGTKLSLRTELIIEWMIREHLPSDHQSREKVKKWILDNFTTLTEKYPR